MCVFCLLVMIETPIYSKDLSSDSPILPSFAQINKRGYVNKPLHIRRSLYPLEIALSLPSCSFFPHDHESVCNNAIAIAIHFFDLYISFPLWQRNSAKNA